MKAVRLKGFRPKVEAFGTSDSDLQSSSFRTFSLNPFSLTPCTPTNSDTRS
jgi:hypothetical protein